MSNHYRQRGFLSVNNSLEGEAFRYSETALKPNHGTYEVDHCSLYELWRKLGGLNEGIIFCEEIYQAMCSEYHPAIKLSQPAIMSRGDSSCIFDVSLPKGTKSVNGKNIEATGAEERLHDVMEEWANMYFHLALGLLNRFGDAGESAVRRAIRRFGSERGKLMREDHIQKQYSINVETLVTYYDLPVTVGFEHQVIETGRDVDRRNIHVCKYHDVWKEYPRRQRHG